MDFWHDFWDIIWYFFLVFAFIAYLFAIFSVIADLFRDRELNGWLKAIWLIFLVFLPFLTVLVYLIARSRGMAERSREQTLKAREATENYIKDVVGTSPADEIEKAKKLLESETITQAEYEQLKAKAMQ